MNLSAIQFVGTQRSGSNLLRVMLNQLPEISAPHPPHILKIFFPLLEHYGDLERDSDFFVLVSDVCEWVNLNPVPWDGIHFNPEVIVEKCQVNTLVEVARRVYEQKAIIDGAQHWCCKSMESIYYTDAIENSDIKPVYIHIFRDGRDVALSFLKAIVGPKHIYHLAKKWEEEQRLSLQLRDRIPADRFISVRYEHLLEEPERIMRDICVKLNIQYRESVMDFFHSHESVTTANSGAMWRNLARPILKNNHHKYLKELDTFDLQLYESIAGEMLQILGYPRVEDLSAFEITDDDIQRFNALNQERILKSVLMADPLDVEKRQPQERLLSNIKNRVYEK